MNVYTSQKSKNYELLLNKLDLLNPLNILKKGYSVVTRDDKVIKDAESLKKGDVVNIRLSNGEVAAKVEEVKVN